MLTLTSMRPSAGFTLLELMVTVAVAAILATVAIPSFTSLIRSNRSASEANEVLSLFNLARSEAIKRNRTVTVCKSADGDACITSGNWEQGAIVFEDEDANGSRSAGEVLIQATIPLSSGSTIIGNSNVSRYVRFNSLGRAASAGTITITPGGSDQYQRAVVLNTTRNPRICYPDKSPSDCPSS